jgi:hypothetical protein
LASADYAYQEAFALLFPRAYFHRWWLVRGSASVGSLYTILSVLGGMEMARGKSKDLPRIDKRADWQTEFVQIPLNGVTMEEINSVFPDEDAVWDGFSSLLDDGYKVGFTYNPTNQAVICSVTCKQPEDVNFNKTFSSFARDWQDALRIALYKHYVLTDKDWSSGGRTSAYPSFG